MAAGRAVRAGAVLGMIGGGLRAAGSFAPALISSGDARTWLYVTIDVCLTAGLLSIYLPRRRRMRTAGHIGFLLALAGLIAARVGPALTHADVYPAAAAAVAVGVLTLAVGEWRARRAGAWIPLLGALSVVVGVIGASAPRVGWLFVASGILFGAGFAAMSAAAW